MEEERELASVVYSGGSRPPQVMPLCSRSLEQQKEVILGTLRTVFFVKPKKRFPNTLSKIATIMRMNEAWLRYGEQLRNKWDALAKKLRDDLKSANKDPKEQCWDCKVSGFELYHPSKKDTTLGWRLVVRFEGKAKGRQKEEGGQVTSEQCRALKVLEEKVVKEVIQHFTNNNNHDDGDERGKKLKYNAKPLTEEGGSVSVPLRMLACLASGKDISYSDKRKALEGYDVVSICGTPTCFNPDHLVFESREQMISRMGCKVEEGCAHVPRCIRGAYRSVPLWLDCVVQVYHQEGGKTVPELKQLWQRLNNGYVTNEEKVSTELGRSEYQVNSLLNELELDKERIRQLENQVKELKSGLVALAVGKIMMLDPPTAEQLYRRAGTAKTLSVIPLKNRAQIKKKEEAEDEKRIQARVAQLGSIIATQQRQLKPGKHEEEEEEDIIMGADSDDDDFFGQEYFLDGKIIKPKRRKVELGVLDENNRVGMIIEISDKEEKAHIGLAEMPSPLNPEEPEEPEAEAKPKGEEQEDEEMLKQKKKGKKGKRSRGKKSS
jgi:hypothetical protein